jgi:hypothetical protein
LLGRFLFITKQFFYSFRFPTAKGFSNVRNVHTAPHVFRRCLRGLDVESIKITSVNGRVNPQPSCSEADVMHRDYRPKVFASGVCYLWCKNFDGFRHRAAREVSPVLRGVQNLYQIFRPVIHRYSRIHRASGGRESPLRIPLSCLLGLNETSLFQLEAATVTWHG